VDSNQDPEFEEDEGIYDELNLNEAEAAYGFANEDDKDSNDSGDDGNWPFPFF
jgi:CCR4-NOT transcription complex subunit 3